MHITKIYFSIILFLSILSASNPCTIIVKNEGVSEAVNFEHSLSATDINEILEEVIESDENLTLIKATDYPVELELKPQSLIESEEPKEYLSLNESYADAILKNVSNEKESSCNKNRMVLLPIMHKSTNYDKTVSFYWNAFWLVIEGDSTNLFYTLSYGDNLDALGFILPIIQKAYGLLSIKQVSGLKSAIDAPYTTGFITVENLLNQSILGYGINAELTSSYNLRKRTIKNARFNRNERYLLRQNLNLKPFYYFQDGVQKCFEFSLFDMREDDTKKIQEAKENILRIIEYFNSHIKQDDAKKLKKELIDEINCAIGKIEEQLKQEFDEKKETEILEALTLIVNNSYYVGLFFDTEEIDEDILLGQCTSKGDILLELRGYKIYLDEVAELKFKIKIDLDYTKYRIFEMLNKNIVDYFGIFGDGVSYPLTNKSDSGKALKDKGKNKTQNKRFNWHLLKKYTAAKSEFGKHANDFYDYLLNDYLDKKNQSIIWKLLQGVHSLNFIYIDEPKSLTYIKNSIYDGFNSFCSLSSFYHDKDIINDLLRRILLVNSSSEGDKSVAYLRILQVAGEIMPQMSSWLFGHYKNIVESDKRFTIEADLLGPKFRNIITHCTDPNFIRTFSFMGESEYYEEIQEFIQTLKKTLYKMQFIQNIFPLLSKLRFEQQAKLLNLIFKSIENYIDRKDSKEIFDILDGIGLEQKEYTALEKYASKLSYYLFFSDYYGEAVKIFLNSIQFHHDNERILKWVGDINNNIQNKKFTSEFSSPTLENLYISEAQKLQNGLKRRKTNGTDSKTVLGDFIKYGDKKTLGKLNFNIEEETKIILAVIMSKLSKTEFDSLFKDELNISLNEVQEDLEIFTIMEKYCVKTDIPKITKSKSNLVNYISNKLTDLKPKAKKDICHSRYTDDEAEKISLALFGLCDKTDIDTDFCLSLQQRAKSLKGKILSKTSSKHQEDICILDCFDFCLQTTNTCELKLRPAKIWDGDESLLERIFYYKIGKKTLNLEQKRYFRIEFIQKTLEYFDGLETFINLDVTDELKVAFTISEVTDFTLFGLTGGFVYFNFIQFIESGSKKMLSNITKHFVDKLSVILKVYPYKQQELELLVSSIIEKIKPILYFPEFEDKVDIQNLFKYRNHYSHSQSDVKKAIFNEIPGSRLYDVFDLRPGDNGGLKNIASVVNELLLYSRLIIKNAC